MKVYPELIRDNCKDIQMVKLTHSLNKERKSSTLFIILAENCFLLNCKQKKQVISSLGANLFRIDAEKFISR